MKHSSNQNVESSRRSSAEKQGGCRRHDELIIKNRHQQALRKLTTERDLKRNQLADLKQTRKERKEANQLQQRQQSRQRRLRPTVDDSGDAARFGNDLGNERGRPSSSFADSSSGTANIVPDDASAAQNRACHRPRCRSAGTSRSQRRLLASHKPLHRQLAEHSGRSGGQRSMG